MIGVLQLRGGLIELGIFTEYQVPPRRQLRAQIQAVAYLMGYTSGLVFGLVLWGQGIMIS